MIIIDHTLENLYDFGLDLTMLISFLFSFSFFFLF
jgi:hypothetical protein